MSQMHLSRRAFLRASLAGSLTLAMAVPAFSITPNPDGMPEGKLSLYNTHTGERLTVRFRDDKGDYDLGSLAALNWILRCHYSNEETVMDVRAIEFLNTLDKEFGGNNEIHVISGYRSPLYNSLLRREGRQVACHSLHLEGKAIDIKIPGVRLDRVCGAALDLRYGGVGYYPNPGFVHIDSGHFRHWGMVSMAWFPLSF